MTGVPVAPLITLTLTEPEDPLNASLPLKEALIKLEPAARAEFEMSRVAAATPPEADESCALPREVLPAENVTVPCGVSPLVLEMVAFRVTESLRVMALALEVRASDVVPLLTAPDG